MLMDWLLLRVSANIPSSNTPQTQPHCLAPTNKYTCPTLEHQHDNTHVSCDGVLRRLFSLARMVEVLLYNLHRIHHLWPIFLDHLGELLTDERASVRAAAIEALGRAVGGALAHVTSGYGDFPCGLLL